MPEENFKEKRLVFFLIISVFFIMAIVSCVEPVNKRIDEASEKIRSENLRSKQDLSLIFQNLIESSDDTILKSQASLLYNKVIKTDNFLDSLQSIMMSLDRDDVKTVNTIKKLLAEGDLGDSLNVYLNDTFQQAKDFSVDQEQKRIIDSIQVNMFKPMGTGESWKSELFGMNSPIGASNILFALQSELYLVGKIAFKQ